MSDEAQRTKNAVQQASATISKPCTTVCSTINCQEAKSRKQTEDLLRERVEENRKNGMNELDAMADATQRTLDDGADIRDILNTFSTKSLIDRDFWRKHLKNVPKDVVNDIFGVDIKTENVGEAPIIMGESPEHPESGFDSQIDDDTPDQMGHIFAYIRYAYLYGGDIARFANETHDPPLEWVRKRSQEAIDSGGVTKEDYVAGLKGASIGEKLANGGVCLEEFGDFLKKQLGQNNLETNQMTKDAEKHRDDLAKQKKEYQELIRLENEREQDEGSPW